MSVAFLFTNVAVVLVACRVRFAGESLIHAAPLELQPVVWNIAIVLAIGLALVSGWRDRERVLGRVNSPGPPGRGVPGGQAASGRGLESTAGSSRRALCELMVIFPGLFAFEWAVLPPYRWRPLDWAIMGVLLALVMGFLWRDRQQARGWGFGGAHLLEAARRLALPTAAIVAALAAVALIVVVPIDGNEIAESLVWYAVYATGQLLVFQVFLVTRLRALSESRRTIVLVASCLFALVHWPNGLLMLATGLGAVLWTTVYLAVPSLYALAGSMALCAVAFAQFVPDHLHDHMRTGPIYVQRRVENEASLDGPPVARLHFPHDSELLSASRSRFRHRVGKA